MSSNPHGLTAGEDTALADPTGVAPIRVVVVDSHRMFAECLARLLDEEDDISAEGICDEVSAAALVGEADPDVVLVDHQLPGGTGTDLTRWLRELQPAPKVIMLRDSWNDDVVAAAVAAGCAGFLTKDQPVDAVGEAVRAVAAGDSLLPPEPRTRPAPRSPSRGRALADHLTSREMEVLAKLAGGAPTRAIASDLHVSVNTIRNYVQSVLRKLGAHSRLEAVSMAVRAGLIDRSK